MLSIVVVMRKRNWFLALLVSGVFFLAMVTLYRMLELMQATEPQRHRDATGGEVEKVSNAPNKKLVTLSQ